MILIVMGVAGAGKTTVGRLLAREEGWPFFDADDSCSAFFHLSPSPERPHALYCAVWAYA